VVAAHPQVSSAEPTDTVSALITTNSGVSLKFDPLIRQPQQAAADLVRAVTSISNGRR
jgi:hypothetical protein